ARAGDGCTRHDERRRSEKHDQSNFTHVFLLTLFRNPPTDGPSAGKVGHELVLAADLDDRSSRERTLRSGLVLELQSELLVHEVVGVSLGAALELDRFDVVPMPFVRTDQALGCHLTLLDELAREVSSDVLRPLPHRLTFGHRTR